MYCSPHFCFLINDIFFLAHPMATESTFCNIAPNFLCGSYVYWTVHHLDS